MAIKRQVLVEFMDIKGLNVVDDFTAQLINVHVTEVNVLTPIVHQPPAFVFQFLFPTMV